MNYKNLVKALKKTPLKAAQIVERCGCSPQSLYNACARPQNSKESTVVALCAAMGISSSEIIDGKVDPDFAKKHFLSMRIGMLQKEHGFSLKDIAELSGIAGNTLSTYKTGKRVPNERTLGKIAEAFGVSPEWLVGDVDVPDAKKKILQDTAIENIKKWLELKSNFNASQLAVEAKVDPLAFSNAFAQKKLTWPQINALSRVMKCSNLWLAGLSYVGAFPGYPPGLNCKFSDAPSEETTGNASISSPVVKEEPSFKKPLPKKQAVSKEDSRDLPEENKKDVLQEDQQKEQRTLCSNRSPEGYCSVGGRTVSDSECASCPFYQEASLEARFNLLEKKCALLEETVKRLESLL